MKYVSYSNYIELNGQYWKVDARKSGLYPHMLKPMLNQLFVMLALYSKVTVIRIDLRQPEFSETNERITIFNRKLSQWLKSKYKLVRYGFVWVREKETSICQHYHYAMILDGHKIRYPNYICIKAGEIWQSLGGKDYKPENCYYHLNRRDTQEIQKAVWRISYFAKARGKGHRPAHTKDYSCSRIQVP